MAEPMQFDLVSPERLLVSAEVESVVVPGSEGYFTVLARHAPLISTLKPGLVEVKELSGAVRKFFVRGGFADVTPAGLTLLAEQAIRAGGFRQCGAGAGNPQCRGRFERRGRQSGETPVGRKQAQRAAGSAALDHPGLSGRLLLNAVMPETRLTRTTGSGAGLRSRMIDQPGMTMDQAAVGSYIRRAVVLRAHQLALQLLQGAAFDLPHALLGNAELLAERFERRAFIGKAALGDDPQLALVQCAESAVQPGRPPLRCRCRRRRFRRGGAPCRR